MAVGTLEIRLQFIIVRRLPKRLPKTRSGKILRKIMRNIADGKTFAPPSTIEDITVLNEMRDLMGELHIGVAFRQGRIFRSGRTRRMGALGRTWRERGVAFR